VVENEIRSIIATSSSEQSLPARLSVQQLLIARSTRLLLLQLLHAAMNYYFNWRPDAVYASLQSHEWYLQDCAWSGWNRTHWHRCNPVCGCDQMTLEDIGYPCCRITRKFFLEGTLLNFLLNPINEIHIGCDASHIHSRIYFLTLLELLFEQLRHFFSHANYPHWHYSDFIHAQTVLKNDYNVPPGISYFQLLPLDYRLCDCDTFVNNIITSPYEPRNILAPPRPERDWA